MVDTKTDPKPDPNISKNNEPEVAEDYADRHYPSPCQELLFDTYRKPAISIRDIVWAEDVPHRTFHRLRATTLEWTMRVR